MADAEPVIDVSLLSSLEKGNEQLKSAVGEFVQSKREHLKSFVASPALRLSKSSPNSLRGFVACLSEHTPLQGTDAESIFTSKTGTGLSWFDVEPSSLSSEQAVEQVVAGFRGRTEQAAGGGGGTFSMTKLGAVLGLYSIDEDYQKRYVVIVRGNDQKTATKLQRRIASAVAAGKTPTLGAVVGNGATGDAYRSVIERSRSMRTKLAQAWAGSHGIVLANEGKPAGWYDTHYVALSPTRSIESIGANAKSNKTYVVYNDATDSASAHNGVWVWLGPAGGFWRMKGKEHVTGEGSKSLAWVNERPSRPSFFPTSTGLWPGLGSSRAAAKHASSNERMVQEVARRMAWDGRVTSYNPASKAVYNDFDGETNRWMRELGAAPGGPVSREEWKMVVIAMPGIDTRHRKLPELVGVAQESGEKKLAVHATSSVVHELIDAWPRLRATEAVQKAFSKEGAVPSLSELLADEDHDENVIHLKSEVLRALHAAKTSSSSAQQAKARQGKASGSSSEE